MPTAIPSDENRSRETPFVCCLFARELFENVRPLGGWGMVDSAPPNCPRRVRHGHRHNRDRIACGSLPCGATAVSVGQAAHVQSGEDPAVMDCFVWPLRLWHTGKPIPGSQCRNARQVEKRADEDERDWRDFANELAVHLRRIRHAAGLSQEDVAYRANLSRFIYRQYEQGESRRGTPANPSLRAVLAIAQALNVNLSELLPDDVPDLRRR